jgi:eukaryotic-like serine/threonine-protein kinase
VTPERLRALEALFHEARKRPPAERQAWLAISCADDPTLRSEVESLLAQPPGVLDGPVGTIAAALITPAPRLAPGATIGSHRIQGLIDVGGMGEVYRARDMRLGRDVAIKILPRDVTADPERLARFEREARLLAALNHPHIAAIYGVAEDDDVRGLVLELVDGQTLARRLKGGALAVDEALRIARQIAEALEAAHEKGVVHRDLKPANIVITPQGAVKVVDFGLGKAIGRAGTGSDLQPLAGPHSGGTIPGVILGTATYMSPEQARGLAVDTRADIWAFGCVLYEMLTGVNPFDAETAADAVARLLDREPDWDALPAHLPAAIRRLVQRCLNKRAADRLHAIADARLEIVDALTQPEPIERRAAPEATTNRWLSIAATACAILAAATIALAVRVVTMRVTTVDDRVARLSVLPPPDTTFSRDFLALSPDGRFVAFVATSSDGRSLLWIRALDALSARPLPGTDEARYPFWSPDSRFIAFFSQHSLKKIQPGGGPAQVICDASYGFGGSWNRDGVIVFAPDAALPLYRVSANGGAVSPVTTLDASHDESSQHSPTFLPDGTHFLYVSSRPKRWISVGALDSSTTRRLIDADSPALYAPASSRGSAGYLVYVRDGALLAQPFDADRLEITGDTVPVADANVQAMVGIGAAAPFSVTGAGVLAYRSFGADTQLTWFDRSGKRLADVGAPERYNAVELAPDGTRIAVERIEPRGNDPSIWLRDADGYSPTGLTFTSGDHPRWSPDGRFVTFNRDNGVLRKSTDGQGSEQELYHPPAGTYVGAVSDWSPDGHLLAIRQGPEGRGSGFGSLFLLPLTPGATPAPIPQTQSRGQNARFSPDGRWLAYTSDESGIPEVYVQPLPSTGAKWLISRGGGIRPRWRSDGKEIFYIASTSVNGAGKLMAVAIDPQLSLRVGAPTPLLDIQFLPRNANDYPYSVSRDGQRILAVVPREDAARAPVTIVFNWTSDLKKR